MADHELDNPGWHALIGAQRHLARVAEPPLAGRYEPDVSVFGGMADFGAAAWDALASVADGQVVAMFGREAVDAPAGWRSFADVPTAQYVAGTLQPAPEQDLVELGAADAPEMQALVELTDPGPFAARTHEMGTYLGVRQGDDLVAMAGQRFRLPSLVEISAVCVHPDLRGRGLGASLTLSVAERIRAGGDEAFLHVKKDNMGAIELYERLGFELRADMIVSVVAQARS